jgi:hypothetical protein
MELIEKTDLRSAYYLASLPKPVSIEIFKHRKTEENNETKYNRLQNFLKEVIKSEGTVTRTYTHAVGTVPEFGGRLFSGNGIQGQPREFRGLLMKHTTDIDMKNAHPTILRYLCYQRGIRCPQLADYVADRDNILATFPDREKAKALFLASINDNKLKKSEHHNKQFKRFDEELKDIQNAFYNMKEFEAIRQSIPSDKASNPQGSTLNRIMCAWEDKILQVAIDVARRNGLEIAVLAFDGFMPYGDHYGNTELLQQLNEACEQSFPGLGMTWSYKSHDATLTVPEDFTIPENTEEKLALLATEKKKAHHEEIENRIREFEKTTCKITNANIYLVEQPNDLMKPVLMKTREKLSDMYSHLEHIRPDMYKLGTVPFIQYWTNNNPRIRQYRDMDTNPNVALCPPDIYNLWIPFRGETLPPAPPTTEYVDFFQKHILIMCGNDLPLANYFKCWIAQMIQYPWVKSNCPVFISQEGAGKGSLLRLLRCLLGESKCLETTTPSRDVWGSFNGSMSRAFLVNLNELSKKETMDSMGQIKGLVTDATISINEKGVPQYQLSSYHRFIITTNNQDPMDTKIDDRRFWIVRCSDELIGNIKYFETLNAHLDNPVAVKSIYDYFKNLEGFGEGFSVENFNRNPKPTTEYQKTIQEANLPHIISWLIHLATTNPEKDELFMLGKISHQLYTAWGESIGVDFKMNAIKLGMTLLNGSNGIVTKGEHTRMGNTKMFNLKMVRERYGLTNISAELPTGLYEGGEIDREETKVA